MSRMQSLGLFMLITAANSLPFMSMWRSPGRGHAIIIVITGMIGGGLLILGSRGKDGR